MPKSPVILPENITSDISPPIDVPKFRGGRQGYDVWIRDNPQNKDKPRPIIIDCDPGLDDAVALLLACANPCALDIKLVTTCCGNNDVKQLTNNALRLLHLLGRSDIPVAQGQARPLCGGHSPWAECVHGIDGLGGVKIPNSPVPALTDDAITAMAKTVTQHPDGITLVTMAPLTNIALFIKHYPHLKSHITQIVSMGGAVFGGNMTPCTEFNYYSDPESVDIVFNSGLPIVMLGLDVTVRAKFHQRHIDSLINTPEKRKNAVARVYHYLTQYCYDREMPHFLYPDREHGMNMHDVTCIAYLLRPDIFTLKSCYGAIELKGTHTRGKTVIDFVDLTNKPHNLDVAFRVDADIFRDLIFNAIDYYK